MLKLWYANSIDYCENILNNGEKNYGKWKNQSTSHPELQGSHRSEHLGKLTQDMIYWCYIT